jgi:radical SAM superfamily enzyme YgiQ (UPF0313 family)
LSISIALINPPNTSKSGEVEENATPPLGLAYIASYLKKFGVKADLFDLSNHCPNSAFDALIPFLKDYKVFGFTSYTKTFQSALSIAGKIKSHDSDLIVLFGGPHVSAIAEELLTEVPDIDFIIKNEGEIPTFQLVQALSGCLSDFETVSNLVYRKKVNEKIVIVSNCSASEMPQLDHYPFPSREYIIQPNRILLEHRRKKQPVQIEFICSSRGCPKRCSFCSIITLSPKYRFRSNENLIEEIKQLYSDHPFGHISFLDPNFFVHYKRALEFSEKLFEWNPDITWSGTATVDVLVKHKEIIEKISSLNCLSLEVGIESGSKTVLKRFNKNTTVEQNIEAISILNSNNLILDLDFIMYDPETTLVELNDNFNFLELCDLLDYYPAYHWFNAMKVYPGTPVATKYGLDKKERLGMETVVPNFTNTETECVYTTMSSYFQSCQTKVDTLLTDCKYLREQTPNYKHGNLSSHQILSLCHTLLRLIPPQLFYQCTNGCLSNVESNCLNALALAEKSFNNIFETIQFFKGAKSPVSNINAFNSVIKQLTLLQNIDIERNDLFKKETLAIRFFKLTYLHSGDGNSIRLSSLGSTVLKSIMNGSKNISMLKEVDNKQILSFIELVQPFFNQPIQFEVLQC